jgi:hypothetical protein
MNKANYSQSVCNRFWNKVKIPKDIVNDCWEWTGYKKPTGVGEIKINGKNVSATTFSYEYYNGKLLKSVKFYRTCKNMACVNPNHLMLKSDSRYMEYAIWDNIIVPEDYINDCWEWTGTKKSGYAYYNEVRLSTFIYELYYKEKISEGIVVRHTCDNRGCVSPNHFLLGTPQDNVDDREKRNRGAKGQNHGMAILNDELIHESLNKVLNGSLKSINQIADYCDISRSIIEKILNQKHWKHIKLSYTDDEWNQILSIRRVMHKRK